MTGANTDGASVTFNTSNGSAVVAVPDEVDDYLPASGTLTWAPGDTSAKTIDISVFGDTLVEPDETFYVTLSSPTNATISRPRGVGTILNDDLDVSGVVAAEAANPKNGILESHEKLRITWATTSFYAIASQKVTVDGRTFASISGPFSGRFYSDAIGVWPVGDHTYTIESTDVNGVTGSTSGTFTVLAPQPPTISAVLVCEAAAPKNGAIESNENLRITWAAVGSSNIASQKVTVDGKAYPSIAGPFSSRYYIDPIGKQAIGTHNYVIKTTDANGLSSTTSGTFTVVAPIPPSLDSIVVAEAGTPKNGTLDSKDKLRITWAATSGNGIASQTVKVDGKTFTAISGPFSKLYFSCAIGTYAAGTHSYTIKTTDTKGVSTSKSGTFSVIAAATSSASGMLASSDARLAAIDADLLAASMSQTARAKSDADRRAEALTAVLDEMAP
jgi:hypothetical protein